MANIPLKSIQFPGLDDTYTVPSNAGELAYNKSATYPADTVGKALQDKPDADGTIANAEQLTSNIYEEDSVPYNFRTSGGSIDIGDRETDMLVGGTAAWNQLVNSGDTSVTVQSGHKYYSNINNTKTIGSSNGSAISINDSTKDNVIDLTQMFGTTIADYIYSLEQANAGAGVAWFKKLFPKPYYAYNAGELMSVNASAHNTVGFNAYDPATGTAKLVGGMQYQITGTYTAVSYSTGETITIDSGGYFTPMANGTLTVTGGNDSDTCVHLVWDGERDGEYEAYVKHSYPLDSDLTLRGIPKLDASNNLYYDGDTYESDGTVGRKYGIVDLGTLNWEALSTPENHVFRTELLGAYGTNDYNPPNAVCEGYVGMGYSPISASDDGCFAISDNQRLIIIDHDYSSASSFASAVNGKKIVYKRITPTTETADPYTNPQIVNDFGTEEYVDYAVSQGSRDVAIPVGHETQYMANLKAKLEMSPNSPEGAGDYIVRQTNGENEYVTLASNATIQDIIARLEALENAES